MARRERALPIFCCQLLPKRIRSRRLIQNRRTSPPGVRLLEANADPAAVVKQGEVAIREVVDILQKVRHEDILLIKSRVEGEAAIAKWFKNVLAPSGFV